MSADSTPSNATHKCLDCGGDTAARDSGLFDTRFGIPGLWSFAVCGSCGLEQVVSPPSRMELDRLYESHYNFGGERETVYTSLRRRFHSSSLYRLWTRIDGDFSFHTVKGSGYLLDAGCNEGRGLLLYLRNGWLVDGLEPNALPAAVAKSLGFTVHVTSLEDFVPTRHYDVVVLSNVLEHAQNPRDVLRCVRSLLNPDGQVWISTPNGASLLRSLFGRFWINWHVPFHVFQFTSRTLGRLLREGGFDAAVMRQETPALWVAQSIIAAACAQTGKPTRQLRNAALVGVLVLCVRAFFFPLLWLANRLDRGDCLLVRAVRT